MKIGSRDRSTKIWSWVVLVLLVCLTGCQRPSLLVPEALPATSAAPTDTTPSDQEQGTSQEVGNPPGPVLTIALLPEGEFLAGVGPIGDVETGFEWQLYRGRGDDWRPLTWPPEAIPRSLHPDPRGGLLYAVPFSNALFGRGQAWGLMRSTDGGRSWKQMLTGLGDPYVMDLALSPTTPSDGMPVLFAITWYSGAYRSADAGETWESMPLDGVVEPSGGPNPYDLAVAISPDYGDSSNQGLLIASFSRRLHRWDTQTQSWQTVSLTVTTTVEDFDPPASQLTAGRIAFSPDFAEDGTIYLHSGYAGLFRSSDRGETWQSISRRLVLPPPFVNDFQLAVASADEAYVLLDSDQADPRLERPIGILYRTHDGGRSWEELTDPPTLGWISTFTLARDDEGQAVLHLGGSQGGVSSHRVDELSWK